MYTDISGNTWYKGNLHTHTTVSDGWKSPEECIALYKADGYDFPALTDHWKPSETYLHESGLLILGGCEYDVGTNVRDGIFHIVAVGCASAPALDRENRASASPQEVIDRIHEAGGLASLAHPCWSMNTLEQLMPLSGVDYTEIFNTTSDLPRNCRPYSGAVLDAMAARGKYWALAATDDTHTYQADLCGSFVYVKAEQCTQDALIRALRAGDFYASQGPRMEITRDGDTVTVLCPEEDAVNCVIAVTDMPWESHRTEMGEKITKAAFTFSKGAMFMRIEIRDEQNRWAWSGYIPK
ncbi:MAG: CehA/McbA family metallohydrolase [Clostridia bacterium]|nr:CehA/McbA family metallohydrolase [Clostridia bacterium]